MVILGLLVGYVAPKYFAQVGKSEVKTAKAQIDSLEKALDMYRLDTGHYPADRSPDSRRSTPSRTTNPSGTAPT